MTDTICTATPGREPGCRNTPLRHERRAQAPDGGEAMRVEMATLRHRLKELQSENIALRTRINRLIVSLSRTLLRGAAS